MDHRFSGNIQLPSTAGRRTRHAFLKLLSRVDAEAQNGFGFEGSLLRPGAWATREQLRPSLEYPATPVLLEHSQASAHGIAGHRRCESVYVLWRWDRDSGSWRELGRAISVAWEWAAELRPLAIRVLAEARGETAVKNAPDFPAITLRISGFLDEQLQSLAPPDRLRLLCILHDQFATRQS